MTLWQPGMTITDERLNDGLEPTEIGTGLTAATKYSVNSFVARRIGSLVYVNALITNVSASVGTSGTDNTVSSENIVGDPTVATLPSGWRPSEDTGCAWDNGVVNGQALIGADGTIKLRTISYQQPLATGSNIRISVCFVQTA